MNRRRLLGLVCLCSLTVSMWSASAGSIDGAATALAMASGATAPAPAPAGPGQDDDDDDGFSGMDDLCPDSPRGAPSIWHGCATIEIVRDPSLMTEPARGGIAELRALFEDSELSSAGRPLDEASAELARARDAAAAGELCDAAAAAAAAGRALGGVVRTMDGAVDARAASVLGGRHLGNDVSRAQIDLLALVRLGEEVTTLRSLVDETADALDGACSTLGRPLSLRARVVDTDDATGRLTLEDGRVVVLPAGATRGVIRRGGWIQLEGVALGDGFGIATEVIGEQPLPPLLPSQLPCLELRIAPVQPFGSLAKGLLLLHDPDGYRWGTSGSLPRLYLEQGMRFAAADAPCAFVAGPGNVARFSLEIAEATDDADYQTEIWDLEPGEYPASTHGTRAPLNPRHVKATVWVHVCPEFGAQLFACTSAPYREERYAAFMAPRNHYARLKYTKTTFGVTGKAYGAFEVAQLQPQWDVVHVDGAAALSAAATGYRVVGGASSRPTLQPVNPLDDFAIYADDLYDAIGFLEKSWQLQVWGVDRPSGLVWPFLSGVRNGLPFRYTARLPAITRDLIHDCPGQTNSFYRLPFTGGWPTWTVGLGNVDDPHHGHPHEQRFAWDFLAPEHTSIRAARPGFVAMMREDVMLNASAYPEGDLRRIGNYVWIQHDDGTIATYLHIRPNGVLVHKGMRVVRGQEIAEVGNTGTSSEPHVHWELNAGGWDIKNGELIGGPSTRALFEALVNPLKLPFGYDSKKCYVPRHGDNLLSTQ